MKWDVNRHIDQSGKRPLRILVADKQPLVCAALAALLTGDGYQVAAQAVDSDSVLMALDMRDLDILLIDIELASRDLLLSLCSHVAAVPVVVLAPSPGDPGVPAALDCGAAGLALKSQGIGSLRLCVGTVAAGGRWVDNTALVQSVGHTAPSVEVLHLTRRERDVARLVATGQRNRAIADVLGISEGTVKMHLHHVFAKLGVENRTELAMDQRLKTVA